MMYRSSFLEKASSIAAEMQSRDRWYLSAAVAISGLVSLMSALVYPGSDSTGGSRSDWPGTFVSRFVILLLFCLVARSAWHLRLVINRWYKTLRVAGLPSLGSTRFLLECKAKRHSYSFMLRRRMPWVMSLLEAESEEEALAEMDRMRAFLPIIYVCGVILLAALSGACMAMFVLRGNVALLLLSIVFLVRGSRFGLDLILPPTVLFLAASREQQFEFQLKLGILCYPLSVISFLDTNLIFTEHGVPKSVVHAATQHSSFRTADELDWEATVRRWLDTIPVVVVDCRAPSSILIQEVEWIICSQLSHKAAFIVTSPKAPLSAETRGMNVLTEDELPEFLSSVLRIPVRRFR